MSHKFSLTTMFLLVAMVALWLSPIRSMLVYVWNGDFNTAMAGSFRMMLAGAVAGMLFGTASGIWNCEGWVIGVIRIVGGACLGAAAGIEVSLPVDWPVMVLLPAMAIIGVILACRQRSPSGSAAQDTLDSPPSELNPLSVTILD
jgi:hypothetical protein